jgi:hypothetical protein
MGSFTVSGELDNTLYEVAVTGESDRPTVGSKRVAALVDQNLGETVLATPNGPAYTVEAGDPKSILALLSSKTNVTKVSPDAPSLVQ